MYRLSKPIETEASEWLLRLGMAKWRVTIYIHQISFGGDENVLELDSHDSCTIL